MYIYIYRVNPKPRRAWVSERIGWHRYLRQASRIYYELYVYIDRYTWVEYLDSDPVCARDASSSSSSSSSSFKGVRVRELTRYVTSFGLPYH